MSDGLSEAMRGIYFSNKNSKFFDDRITNDHITSLNKNEIFVFGSNTKGIHGAGAAKLAMKWGAEYGIGVGIQGSTYAIPSKDNNIETLPLDDIKSYIDEFIEYAKNNEDKTFLVTEIGTGLAGYDVLHIAPLFKNVKNIKNIHLSYKFWKIINRL